MTNSKFVTALLFIQTDRYQMIPVSFEDCPDLFEAFEKWRTAPHHTSAEDHAWLLVLFHADEYLEDVLEIEETAISVQPEAVGL